MTLSDVVDHFLTDIEQLDLGDDDHLLRLGRLTNNLARDAAAQVADYPHGEPVALVSL